MLQTSGSFVYTVYTNTKSTLVWTIISSRYRFTCTLIPAHKPMYSTCICQHTHKLVLCSHCPMGDIIKFPPGFPPGLPRLVKANQNRKNKRAHVATPPSSESCLFHDWRDWGCRFLGSFFIWVESSSTTDASYNPWHSMFWHDTGELTWFEHLHGP